jgi:osomolarity two-component system response regulator SSK1
MQALIDFDGWRKWKDFDADKAFKEKKVKRLSRASAEGTAVAPRSPRPTATAEVVAAPPATATAASNNGEGALMTTTTEKAT